MSFKSALVTGAAGFIGSALARALTRTGREVICLARGDAPVQHDLPILRTPSLAAAAAADIGDRRVDVVFHLAAYGVPPDQRSPDAMFEANVSGVRAVVALAQRLGAKTVVYSGSCAEYAESKTATPLSEDSPLTTTALYGATKAAGGFVGAAFAAEAGIAFQWLRLFGVYGPGEGPNRLLPYLIRRLRAGERVDLSPGEQMRDLLFIEDAVAGLIAAAEAGAAGRLGPYNLCSGEAVSVRSVALRTAEALGCSADLLDFGARPYRPDENMWTVGDNARFMAAADWRPRIDLRQGLRAMTVDHSVFGSSPS